MVSEVELSVINYELVNLKYEYLYELTKNITIRYCKINDFLKIAQIFIIAKIFIFFYK